MSDNYKLTGGARIGFSNATYPFADLYVDKNVLKINNLRIIKKEFNLFSSELTFICKSN